ncbi:MAG: dihydropteroate synthase [Deltaproteobacteria bacterium]|nr:dihydropteroate synthase [Deltaproteobacteria bacterium]
MISIEEEKLDCCKIRSNNLKLRGFSFDLNSKTLIMGVLNVTPDSFFDGGKYTEIDKALKHIDQMINDGADIIDIGGESTRPGSYGVSEDEELRRVIPAVKETVKRYNVPVSIDTTKSKVAKEALDEGASIVNDISGLKFDPGIANMVATYKAGLVIVHTSSHPIDMQNMTNYDSIVHDIIKSLRYSVELAESTGVSPDSIVVDPGIGFGKTTEQNLKLLKCLKEFLILRKPVLIGTSRKSFIGRVIGSNDLEDRLEGTAATVTVGIMNGASMIRVHDVQYMKRVAKIADAIVDAK